MSDVAPSSAAPGAQLPTVLFFSRDIFFAPAVKSAAFAAGCSFVILGQVDAELSAEVTASVRACVVDLTPLSTEQIAQWGERLGNRFPGARRIAFGPHVQTANFAAASAAGFESVLPKGQVAARLASLLS